MIYFFGSLDDFSVSLGDISVTLGDITLFLTSRLFINGVPNRLNIIGEVACPTILIFD